MWVEAGRSHRNTPWPSTTHSRTVLQKIRQTKRAHRFSSLYFFPPTHPTQNKHFYLSYRGPKTQWPRGLSHIHQRTQERREGACQWLSSSTCTLSCLELWVISAKLSNTMKFSENKKERTAFSVCSVVQYSTFPTKKVSFLRVGWVSGSDGCRATQQAAYRIASRQQSEPQKSSWYTRYLVYLPVFIEHRMGTTEMRLLLLMLLTSPELSYAKLPSFDPEFFQFDDELVWIKASRFLALL